MSANLNSPLNAVKKQTLDLCNSSQSSLHTKVNTGANWGVNADPSMNTLSTPAQSRSTNLCNVPEPNVQPMLVDINNSTFNEQAPQVQKDINIPQKKDEIASVKEKKNVKQSKECKNAAPPVRRNPPRKSSLKQDLLKKDHLMEEDFALLDKLDRASSVKGKSAKLLVKSLEVGSSKSKRPCNTNGKKVKPLKDITAELPNMLVEKKQKRAPSIKAMKPISNCAAKKRGRPAKKVPASDLTDLVSTTFEMVEKFVKDNKGTLRGSKNDINALVRNQATLLAYVRGDYDRKKVTARVKEVLKQK
ncbi:uncharacterized protein [Euwallacea fornicatus]|uniref:uncharacterized protein isoform X2 n=1 Tax=Euwallacea fornicatus TaxID=995702 RepID=UPI00338FFBB1